MIRNIFLSEKVVITAIVLNAIVITWLYVPGHRDDTVLMTLDKIFTMFFILEAAAKIGILGARQYFGSALHRFDFFLVVAGIPSLFVGVIDLPDTSFLLLLRVLRLLRLLRFLQFIPHIDRILSGLGRAVKSSLLVLIVLALFNFILAIFTCHFFGDIAPDMFGDPLMAMFSIFQLFTVEGWNEIPEEITQALKESDASWYMFNRYSLVVITKFYFAMVVLIGGIFGLSLANAVFVGEMTMDNNDEIDEKIDALQRQLNQIQKEVQTAVELLQRQKMKEG